MSKALQVLKRQIRDGEFDEDLDDLVNSLIATVTRRRRRLREELLDDFGPGVRVMTTPGNYKPRYYANRKGTVTRVENGVVWIELDTPILRSRGTIKQIGMSGVEWLEILTDE
jgi:hypothetical protein